jgi:pimeloyl-ACP methyl ester carboxylesterase
MNKLISYIDDRYRHEERWVKHLLEFSDARKCVYLLWGRSDAVAPVTIFDRVRDLLKLDTIHAKSVDGMGHWLMAEQPERFVTEYVSALRAGGSI